MSGLSERKEAEESCLPPTLSLVGIPLEGLALPDAVAQSWWNLSPPLCTPQLNISNESSNRNYLTCLSPPRFPAGDFTAGSEQPLGQLSVSWCSLISPSAMVTKTPNICQTLWRETIPSARDIVCPKVALVTVSQKKSFLYSFSFRNVCIPRIELLFLPLVGSLRICLKAELDSSTELPSWLKSLLII